MITLEASKVCHHCLKEGSINLRGMKKTDKGKTLQYQVCLACCETYRRLSKSTTEGEKSIDAFWKTIFSNIRSSDESH